MLWQRRIRKWYETFDNLTTQKHWSLLTQESSIYFNHFQDESSFLPQIQIKIKKPNNNFSSSVKCHSSTNLMKRHRFSNWLHTFECFYSFGVPKSGIFTRYVHRSVEQHINFLVSIFLSVIAKMVSAASNIIPHIFKFWRWNLWENGYNIVGIVWIISGHLLISWALLCGNFPVSFCSGDTRPCG